MNDDIKKYLLAPLAITLFTSTALANVQTPAEWHEQMSTLEGHVHAIGEQMTTLSSFEYSSDVHSADRKVANQVLTTLAQELDVVASQSTDLNQEIVHIVWQDAKQALSTIELQAATISEEYTALKDNLSALLSSLAPKTAPEGTWESVEQAITQFSADLAAMSDKLDALKNDISSETADERVHNVQTNITALASEIAQLQEMIPYVAPDPATEEPEVTEPDSDDDTVDQPEAQGPVMYTKKQLILTSACFSFISGFLASVATKGLSSNK